MAVRDLRFLLAGLFLLLGCGLQAAHGFERGAQIIVTDVSGYLWVSIQGTIEEGDAARFAVALEPYQGMRGSVVLESPGGSLAEGLDIAAQVRRAGLNTMVADGLECHSVCALIWLAGGRRYLTEASVIGVHAAYFHDADGVPLTSGPGNATVGSFLTMLGLPLQAIRYITTADADRVAPITPAIARRLGILVWEHRDGGLISPHDAPTPHMIARQVSELSRLKGLCSNLLGLDPSALETSMHSILEKGYAVYGSEVFGPLLADALDRIDTDVQELGFVFWCLDTEAQLRGDGVASGILSPSFNCAYARTPSERTICAEPDLWPLDRVMSLLFYHYADTMAARDAADLRAEQTAWLGRRDRCQADAGCLVRTYRIRIADLMN